MPSKLLDGYRFFFYSNERNEPAHMHAWKGGSEAKFGWVRWNLPTTTVSQKQI